LKSGLEITDLGVSVCRESYRLPRQEMLDGSLRPDLLREVIGTVLNGGSHLDPAVLHDESNRHTTAGLAVTISDWADVEELATTQPKLADQLGVVDDWLWLRLRGDDRSFIQINHSISPDEKELVPSEGLKPPTH
jgi:hypothetical protein